jgi:hypothetical protein
MSLNYDWKLEAVHEVLDALSAADDIAACTWLDAIADDSEHRSENTTALFEILERSHFYCESCGRWFSRTE